MTASYLHPLVSGSTRSLPRLVGRIASVHNGYAFLHQVETLEGASFPTNGDVFLHPSDNPDVALETGRLVEFSLTTDPRNEGRYRALGGVMSAELPALVGEALQLPALTARQNYHARAKAVDPHLVRQAFANHPLGAVVGTQLDDHLVELESLQEVQALVEAYLDEVFPGIRGQGVVFDLSCTDRTQETAAINTRVAQLKSLGMSAQAALLETEYLRFLVTFDSLRMLVDVGVLAPGVRLSIEVIGMLVGNPERLRLQRSVSSASKAEFIQANETFAATIRFLKDNGLLKPVSAIPIQNVADLFMAAPVWYVASHENITDTQAQSDPLPDHVVKYFGSLLGTQEWANLYQMFNRRTRPLALYQGDQMPPHIIEALTQALTHFDYVVIATPFHDVAGRDWEDPSWQALIDPYLVGFKKGVPYMFFLGRWSDTGVFPLIGEMIADTIAYLTANKSKLVGFGNRPYWHFCNPNHPDADGTENKKWLKDGSMTLQSLVDELVAHYEQGTLFDFLRGTSTALTRN